MKHKILLIILLALILPFVNGCSDTNSFHSAYQQFWDSYYKATEFFELDDNRIEALKKMDSDSVEGELKNMSAALTILCNEAKSEKEKRTYEALKGNYDDLKYLLDIHNQFDKLSDDEKMDVDTKLVGVFINRDGMKKED